MEVPLAAGVSMPGWLSRFPLVGDFSELLDNYMMIEEIIDYDNQVIDSLVAFP